MLEQSNTQKLFCAPGNAAALGLLILFE